MSSLSLKIGFLSAPKVSWGLSIYSSVSKVRRHLFFTRFFGNNFQNINNKNGLTRGIEGLNAPPFRFGGKITLGAFFAFFARREADVEKEKKKKTGESCCVGAKHPGQVSSFNWSFLFQLDMIDCRRSLLFEMYLLWLLMFVFSSSLILALTETTRLIHSGKGSKLKNKKNDKKIVSSGSHPSRCNLFFFLCFSCIFTLR